MCYVLFKEAYCTDDDGDDDADDDDDVKYIYTLT